MDKDKVISLIRKWSSAYINNCVPRDNKKDLAEMNDVIKHVETHGSEQRVASSEPLRVSDIGKGHYGRQRGKVY